MVGEEEEEEGWINGYQKIMRWGLIKTVEWGWVENEENGKTECWKEERKSLRESVVGGWKKGLGKWSGWGAGGRSFFWGVGGRGRWRRWLSQCTSTIDLVSLSGRQADHNETQVTGWLGPMTCQRSDI